MLISRNDKQMNERRQCPSCDRLLEVTLRPDTPHYGEIRCPDHGHSWVPKPDEVKRQKRKKNTKLRKLMPDCYNGFCELCLRPESSLKTLNPSLSLEVHHVIECRDGGKDVTENLRLLCAECHELVHARRRSFNRYS